MEQASNEQGLYIYGDLDVTLLEIDTYLQQVFPEEKHLLAAPEGAKRDFVNLFEVDDIIYDNCYTEGSKLIHQDVTLDEFISYFRK